MVTKRILPAIFLAVSLFAAVSVWREWDDASQPVSDTDARAYFVKLVEAVQADDFERLCFLASTEGSCRFELESFCPTDFGSGPAPSFPQGEELERECREAAPDEAPAIVASRHRPARDGRVGGRMLVVSGVDGRGRPYETEVLIIRDDDGLTAQHSVYWSGDKFEEDDSRARADLTDP